jgi:hypothetical protein
MRQGPVAKCVIGTEAEDASGELLIRDVDDLGVVVGIHDNNRSTRPGHPHQLAERSLRASEMLKRAIGPTSVELQVAERQCFGIRDMCFI